MRAMNDADLMRKANPGEIIKLGATVFVVSEVVDGHVWGVSTRHPELKNEFCRVCGIMRRGNRNNGPCKGPVTIRLW